MANWYAVKAKDILGNTRLWVDCYRTVKEACKEAKDYKREHPHHSVLVLKEYKIPGHTFGATWEVFRNIN